ncbi:thiol:disulfide interchange protein DsbA/DsbL [Nitrosomonas sp.]|uniref:thiol:disulfide interchange protein DsbA/DsbL n=1 Tax=Nitrosomonas sp. TaxID=42353 RepID=UPI0025CF0480|nr:thiol:disulfide interchange protein DsbA/DsbL [Nitrosomonas sp.]MCC6917138.1 thiol:disulfide interchange protein DsbA/DsbL [Nitrosomonas sp.]
MAVRKLFFFLLSIAAVNLAWTLTARAEIVEGKDYTVLSAPQPTDSDAQHVEVIEFFWYGCPHCNDLHPYLDRWLENKPADVEFHFVPAVFRNNWVPAAKTFYALESLGLTQTLHDRIYHAIHREKMDLSKESALFDWIGKQGVDRDKFIGAYNSFTVQNQANRAAQMTRQYKLTGVPALVVGGRYVTSGKAGGLPQDTVSVLNQLIEKVREENKSR